MARGLAAGLLGADQRQGLTLDTVQRVAIYGAGELGATVARLLAESELCRRVVLVDPDEGRAKGKALDLMQSGPVEGYDTVLEGVSVLEAAGDCDAVILADGPVFGGATSALPSACLDLARATSRVTAGPVLVAPSSAAAFIETAVRSGHPRDRVMGTAGAAFEGAVRAALAALLEARPIEIALSVLGSPPVEGLVPLDSATCGGLRVDALSPVALRRAVESARKRTFGPTALAAAAVRVLTTLNGSGGIEPVTLLLDGEYGHRDVALTVAARVGRGRVERVMEIALEPVDRVALDRAAEHRRQSR